MKLQDAGIYDLKNIFTGQPSNKHRNTTGVIINNQENSIYRFINIPAYQRPYRWGEDRITQLFDDYDDNGSGEYFLGATVAIQGQEEVFNDTKKIEFDVVDGQQRITTLYLLNYLRFLLKKEITLNSINSRGAMLAISDFEDLKNIYVDYIGKNSKPFDNIIDYIKNIPCDNLDDHEKSKKIYDYFKKEMCIPNNQNTEELTISERKKKANNFFKDEFLSLKYSRDRYNQTLKKALCNVYLKHVSETNDFELCVISGEEKDTFLKNYTDALYVMFKEIWKRAKNKSALIQNVTEIGIAKDAYNIITEMLNNLSICVVVTSDDSDANKLFEVLNDRSLEVDDLELLKNHFYKEYCLKSGENEECIDKNISILDEIWMEKALNPNTNSITMNKFISFLSTVYITSDAELDYRKNLDSLKNNIERKYSNSYNRDNNKYTYQQILADFNVFYAVRIILKEFGYSAKKNNNREYSFDAEQKHNMSITYKAFHLLLAFEYYGVISSLTNIIISNYCFNMHKDMTSDSFADDFTEYVKGIIYDSNHSKEEYLKIHKLAFMLWTAALKSEDYEIPRNISKRIIKKYNKFSFDDSNMDFESNEANFLSKELDDWLNSWNYSNDKKRFALKIILFNLLMTRKKDADDCLFEIELDNPLTYTLDPKLIQLDHLEASSPNKLIKDKYYKSNNEIERTKELNEYIGNFMVLDSKDNLDKSNYPLIESLGKYTKYEQSWLVKEIIEMTKDSDYFDTEKMIPKKEFFVKRSDNLKRYIKAYLNRSFGDKILKISK